MKFEVTLTTDQFAALSKAPGRSAQQRMQWLVKFWQAVCQEHESKQKKPKLQVVSGVVDGTVTTETVNLAPSGQEGSSPSDATIWNGTEHPVDMTDPEVQAVVGLDENGNPVA